MSQFLHVKLLSSESFAPRFTLNVATTIWWSLPTSAPLFTLTSVRERRQVPLIMKWSIWFVSLSLEDYQVSFVNITVWKECPSEDKVVNFAQSSTSLVLFLLVDKHMKIKINRDAEMNKSLKPENSTNLVAPKTKKQMLRYSWQETRNNTSAFQNASFYSALGMLSSRNARFQLKLKKKYTCWK